MDPKSYAAELKLLSPWAVRPEALEALVARSAAQRTSADAEVIAQAAAAQSAVAVAGAVAVIPLRGLITPRGSLLSILFGGSGGLQAFRASLREALANDEIGAIVLDVDSPGGSVELVPETAAEVFAARARKPIVAIANAWAASAAYWIASQADELMVTPSGEVGSIGVFSVHDDWSGFNQNLGVLPTYIYAGKHKVEMNPDEPLTDEARAAEQLAIDEYYELFTADVARGRGVTPDAVRSGFGEGRMVTSRRAIGTGLADRVETFEATVSRAAQLAVEARREAHKLGRSAQDEPQSGDNPEPNSEEDDEARARIARLVADQPIHL